MRAKRVLTGLATFAAVITGTTVAAPAASAARGPIEGCPYLYLCFYFNSGYGGAAASYFSSDGDLGDELFNWGGTNGRGVQVKNNAASVVNNTEWTAVVYYNSSCNGSVASQSIPAFRGANLIPAMKNNNASFKWPAAPTIFSDCAKRDQDG